MSSPSDIDNRNLDRPQRNQPLTGSDVYHLQILSICHYILGGMTALFGALTIMWMLLVKKLLLDPDAGFSQMPQQQQAVNQLRSFIDNVFGGQQAFESLFMMLIYASVALVVLHVFFTFLVGYCIQIRKQWLAIIIFEAMNLFSFPFGTALSVFTMIVLLRPQVKDAFNSDAPTRETPALF